MSYFNFLQKKNITPVCKYDTLSWRGNTALRFRWNQKPFPTNNWRRKGSAEPSGSDRKMKNFFRLFVLPCSYVFDAGAFRRLLYWRKQRKKLEQNCYILYETVQLHVFFLLVRLLRTQCTQSSWEIRGDMFCCGKEPGARRATWMKLIAGDGLFGELNKNIFTMREKNGRASLIFRAKDNGIVIVVVGSLNRYWRSINSTKIIYCVPKSTFRSTAHFQFKQNGIFFLLHPPFRPNLILCIVTQLT